MHDDAMLIDLYGCAAEPARWPNLLDRLCDEIGACSAVVQSFAFDGNGVRLGWQAMDTRTQRSHARPGAQLATHDNPRLDRRRGLRGLNRIVRDDELFDRDDPARELLQPLNDGRYLGIALHRAVDDPCDFDAAQVTRLERLAPHLRQACELTHELHDARGSLDLLRSHLDGLRCGLIVCDRDAQVRWLNHRARGLADGGELQLHARTLRGRRSAGTEALHALIDRAGALPRFLVLGDGSHALHLAARADGGSVLIAITRSGDATAVPVEAWCTLLRVTHAEAALVATLAEGGTLEQHAQRRSVGIGTVRGQLKQVLAKTGTNRQAELVRLALSSAAAHLLASVPDLRA